MRQMRSSIFLKVAAFILLQVFFIIILLSVFIGVTYWNYDDASFDILEQEDFTKTNYFKRLLEDNIYELIVHIQYCGYFQTNGMTDTGRIVDIYDYVQNDRITGRTTISIGYPMQDLLDWYQEGFYYISGTDPYDYEIEEYGEETDSQLVESYLNTAGISLASYAEAEQLEYGEVCEKLEEAAGKLDNEFREYKKKMSLYKSNNTNLRYAMLDADSQELYTNMDVADISEGMEAIKGYGAYVLFNFETSDFDSNIFYSEEQLMHYLNTLYLDKQNAVFAVGVDTQFPVLDTFHKEELRYNTFERWFRTIYQLLLISIIGYIVCLVYLSAAAGHKRGCEGIAVTHFEKLKTELLVFLFLGGGICFGNEIGWVMQSFLFPMFDPMTFIRVGLLSLSASLVFTICYLSFLRRVKAGMLWSGSLLYAVLGFGRRMFQKRSLALRSCICYAGFLLLVLFLLMLSDGEEACLLLIPVSLPLAYLMIRDKLERQKLIEGCRNIADGNLEFQIDTAKFHKENKQLGETINQISLVLHEAVEDSIKNERLKTNLITNVSHDIKTPLTSIISYISLLKDVSLQEDKAKQYLQILEDKSQRLRHLTEDLIEASKISSGNITLDKAKLDLVELVNQTGGEFYERFRERKLAMVVRLPEKPVIINADGRRIWRILENIYGNALKYSLENTRIYVKLAEVGTKAVFSLKNVSIQPLDDMDSEELTKRFVRGDVSRSTEGSGLGLSIARDLTELHGGVLEITTDGDLFCVMILLPLAEAEEPDKDRLL